MWYGIVMSDEEISEKYQNVFNMFNNDNRKEIPKLELSNAISKEFDIPNEVADAYMTIGLTYFSNDWFTILDNVVRLIRTNMVHSVYNTLKAAGVETTIENAKKKIDSLKNNMKGFDC